MHGQRDFSIISFINEIGIDKCMNKSMKKSTATMGLKMTQLLFKIEGMTQRRKFEKFLCNTVKEILYTKLTFQRFKRKITYHRRRRIKNLFSI